LIKGIVYKSTGSWYTVKVDNGEMIDARLKGTFRQDMLRTTNPIAVGDCVEMESENGDYMIAKIEKRSNYVIRQSPKHRAARHIIASNIDQLCIIASIYQPRTSSGFIDRCLVTAEAYHIPCVIVFNKVDLLREQDKETLLEWTETYINAGYEVLHTTVEDPKSIVDFKSKLSNKSTLFTGHSGVGKSTLLNLICPDLELRTNIISSVHNKGMHTTTFAEMFQVDENSTAIDTPGIKEFGVLDVEKNELGGLFPEFRKYISECKFNNCTHTNEPYCAVKVAVENGQLSSERFINYLNILEDLDSALKNWELAK
jgi:ribosome biogenesis GTPase / thiamine phosphate phosphatase